MSLLAFLIEHSGKISAALTLGGTVFFLGKKAVHKVKPYLNLVDSVAALDKKLDKISAEFQYDHGSSMKDQMGKIEKTLERNTKITELIFNRQRWLMDTRTEPMFEADQNGNFTWANVAFTKLVKRNINDLLGNKWRNIVSEDHRENTLSQWDSAVEDKRNFEQTIYLTDRANHRYVATCIAALQDDGNYIGTLSEIEKAVDK